MPKTYPVRNSFNAGEVSELISGFREDLAKYSSSCVKLENAVPLVEGGAKKMPGTYFAGGTGLGGAMFIGSITDTTLTIEEVIYGTVRVGQTVTGPGVTPGTVIDSYNPTFVPFYTYYNSTRTAVGHATSKWSFVGNQWRSNFNPGTSDLSDLTFNVTSPFAIPLTAEILGVDVSAVLISQSATAGVLSRVSLWTGGVFGAIKDPNTPFVHAPQTETYGSSVDKWGVSVIPPATANDPSFGFAMAANCDGVRVFIGQPFEMTVYYQIETMVPSGEPGGVGSYTVNNSQTVGSEMMQTASSGKSRLAAFQFSTVQGAILEFSAGIVRIWEGASQGSWSLGIALQTPSSGVNYDPATAYIAGNLALVGPYAAALFYTSPTWIPNPSLGVLTFAAPYGTSFSNVVPITFTTNGSDVLSVTIVGSSPNQGINIALANATQSKNSAATIQASIRSLGTLNSAGNNYVDLSGWTVTPDPNYYATPWITAPTIAPGSQVAVGFTASFVAQCVASNTASQFPVIYTGAFNAIYWEVYNASAQLPIELITPYLEADLFALDCSTQSADVLWVFHPSYPPAVIERLGANSWAYSLSLPGQQAGEPPYRGTLGEVKTGYSALGQSISTITKANPAVVTLASSAAGFVNGSRIYINLCAGMVELNQGEFLVYSPTPAPSNFSGNISGTTLFVASGSVGSIAAGWIITGPGVSSGTTVTGVDGFGTISVTPSQTVPVLPLVTIPITATPPGGGAVTFSLQDPDTLQVIDSTGYLDYVGGGFAVQVVPKFAVPGDYPACGTLYQERLCAGGSDNNPTQMEGSVQDDYPDFICDPNEDDYAIQFTLVSNQVNQLLNMIGTPNALLIGTSGGVWVMTGSNGASLSQTNVSASQQSSIGVSALQPQLVNGSAIFVSRSARIVTFLVYNFTTNAWENSDLTRLNRNITIGNSQEQSGIAQTAFQVEPYPIFWAVRNDGQLIGLVFNTQDQVYAWFRVDMTAQGGTIESCAVISGSNQEDQLAVVVKRTINGVITRFVEYFMPQEMFGQLSNAFFVHCGQQLNGGDSASITGISNANPTVVTAPGHGFNDGMTVQIKGVQGMTEINQSPTQAYTVSEVTSNSFQLEGMDSTDFDVYTGGGTVTQVFNQVSGMNYLLGNTVVAVGDGALILEPTVVMEDVVTFPYYANLITIGIPYKTTIQPTNPVLSSQAATTRGMPQKLNRASLSLYQAMGGQYGTDSEHMYDLNYGPGTQSKTPQTSTKLITVDMDADWSDEDTFIVTQDDPLPFTLRGVVFRLLANQD